jgi:hypothetical protein
MPAHRSLHASSLRHRLAVASRVGAALLGGYGLVVAFAVAFARVVHLPAGEALNTAALPAFLLYPAAAVWAFYASTATRAWLGIGLLAIAFAALAWLLGAAPSA